MNIYKLESPFKKEKDLSHIQKGDIIYLSGWVYVMRDKAHKRFLENDKDKLDLKGYSIFYAGPTEKGIIGPTTSSRMDPFTLDMAKLGVRLFIGKGDRDKELLKILRDDFNSLYGITFGGLASFLTKHVKKSEVIMYEEFGCESIRKIKLKNFPVIIKN